MRLETVHSAVSRWKWQNGKAKGGLKMAWLTAVSDVVVSGATRFRKQFI